MKIQYDADVDALSIRLDDGKVVDSEMISPGVVVDYNAQDQVVGIEVFSIRKRKMPIQVPDLGKLTVPTQIQSGT
jgi:uncharacterized protein YuzE